MNDTNLADHLIWKGRELLPPDDSRLTGARIRLAHLPLKKLKKSTWDHYGKDSSFKKTIFAYLDSLNERRKDGMGLLLAGTTGVGKTSAAVLLAKEIIRRDGFPIFVEARELQSLFFSKEDDDKEFRRKLRVSTFLIIDDLGDQPVNDFSGAIFEGLIRDRDNRMLPTIITTNLDREKFIKAYGEACHRVVKEMCTLVHVEGN